MSRMENCFAVVSDSIPDCAVCVSDSICVHPSLTARRIDCIAPSVIADMSCIAVDAAIASSSTTGDADMSMS